MANMNAFNVYKGRKLIDTTFWNDGITAEEVKNSLINHDGYDSDIRVCKRKFTEANRLEIMKDEINGAFEHLDYEGCTTVNEKVKHQIDYMRDTRRKETVRELCKTYVEGGGFIIATCDAEDFLKKIHAYYKKSNIFDRYADIMAYYLEKVYRNELIIE